MTDYTHKCGHADCDGVERMVREPYMADVENKTVYVWMCEGAYANRCEEI